MPAQIRYRFLVATLVSSILVESGAPYGAAQQARHLSSAANCPAPLLLVPRFDREGATD